MSVHGIDDDKRPNQKKYIQMYQDYREKVGQFVANVQNPDKPNSVFESRNTAFGG